MVILFCCLLTSLIFLLFYTIIYCLPITLANKSYH